jgi:hypothetical protein
MEFVVWGDFFSETGLPGKNTNGQAKIFLDPHWGLQHKIATGGR